MRSRPSGPAMTSRRSATSATVVAKRAHHGVLRQVGDAEGRDPPVAGLQPDEAREARRRPDRAAAIAGRAEGDQAGGDGGARSAAGAAGSPARVPRVASDAEDRAGGVGPGPELGGRRLAERDGPSGAQPLDVDLVLSRRRSSGEPPRAPRRRHAGAILEVLHAEGHAGQRAELAGPAARHRTVDGGGLIEGARAVEVHERVERTVALLDDGQALAHQVGGRDLARSHELGGFDGGGHGHPATVQRARVDALRALLAEHNDVDTVGADGQGAPSLRVRRGGGVRHRLLHGDPGHDHRQRGAPHAEPGVRRRDVGGRVGGGRLPAQPGGVDPGLGLDRRPIRDEADVPVRHRDVHGGLRAVRAGQRAAGSWSCSACSRASGAG